jgi:hypothetical protein
MDRGRNETGRSDNDALWTRRSDAFSRAVVDAVNRFDPLALEMRDAVA